MDHPVFVSYSSPDQAVATQICESLEKGGHACWIAPRDIEPGADYPSAILNGLQNARALVVIVTPASLASPHVLSEIGHAFGEKKPIIPFRLSAAPLPPKFDYFLSLSQWLDAHDGCTPENLARLNEAVSQALAGNNDTPQETTRARNRWWYGAAAAVFLLATAAAAYWRWPATPHPKIVPLPPPDSTRINPPETKPQPWVNPKDGLTYVWIPPGTFTMGCSPGDTECAPDEGPTHLVELPAGFWMGQTEVTNAAYHRTVASPTFPANEASLPVIGLSWLQAKAYCAQVGARLPTEAEWEYAARGGIAGATYGVPAKIAWYGGNSDGVRHAVATLQPNAYGLYDMLGNASEWVLDRYYNKYDIEAPAIGNVDQPHTGNSFSLTRGAYWESEVQDIRVSRRSEQEHDLPVPMAGVRCIADKR
jgi:formylglycine-generating enzyme required for sulfatase activity